MTMKTPTRRQILAAGAGASAIAASAAVAQTVTKSTSAAPDLSGKSVLITGSSSGFGYLGALHYARLGAKVFATMRDMPRVEAGKLIEAARAEKLDLIVLEMDVLSDDSVAAAVLEAERLAGGSVDVLVNNAGIGSGAPVELQDMDMTRLLFDTNVMGYQRVARAVLPGMRKKKSGVIFNVSSQLGRVMIPGMGLYSATKFAVESMSEQMAYELVPHGVDVTIIQPGGYPTDIWDNGNKLTAAMLKSADDARKAAYPELVASALRDGGGTTDPMDVPRAIAEIIAMSPGKRPLRRAVHPGRKPQTAINDVSAQVQTGMLGNSPFGPWVNDVNGRG